MTRGWPVKPSALATYPTTRTMRATESRPTSSSIAASPFSAQTFASAAAASTSTEPPTLPVRRRPPSTNGS
jgi:hypothetical protein